MKFRLINTKTNEETICDKITRGGFDYYVSKADIGIRDYFEVDGQLFQCLTSQEADDLAVSNDYPKVIATTNSNIDIPQIVDEARELAKKEHYDGTIEGGYLVGGFINGYNKAKETYQFTEKDMINFAWWLKENIGRYSCDRIAHFEGRYFQTWKEQQPKTLYYNA